jgi:hypothetical protein
MESPTATPKRKVASTEAVKNDPSQNPRQARPSRLLRNSIETALKMRAKRSSMNAR